MADVVSEIWALAVPGEYPKTAEGRAAIDRHLKRLLHEIAEEDVRAHAAHLIREKRMMAMLKDQGPTIYTTRHED